jgi:cytochrome b
LIFRILWGFVGSSTARFGNFVRGPRGIADYWRGGWRGIGHNPLGALSVLALLLVTAVQVGLGLVSQDEDGIIMGPLAPLVSSDTSDKARDIHELWFYVLLAFIALHLLANDYGPRVPRAWNRADAARQMVGGAGLPGGRSRHHPLGHRRRAAFWFLIATHSRTTSPAC